MSDGDEIFVSFCKNEQVEIEITNEIFSQEQVLVFGKMFPENIKSQCMFCLNLEIDFTWTLTVYSHILKKWCESKSFPEFELNDYFNRKVIEWIAQNVKIMLFLAGE